jgi:drug/metabolite transporter (DMT)-like permease
MTLMLTSVVCFTTNVLLVRALSDMHAANIWLVSCARFVVGLAMIVTLYRSEFEPTHLWLNRQLINRGLVGGLGVYITYLCVVKLGAGRAVFINNTYVLWAPVLAAWILRERLRPAVAIGGIIALGGLALLTNVFATGSHPGVYDVVAVISALMSAYIVVTIRQLHATEHTSTIFAAQCVYGLLICSVPAAATFVPIAPAAWGVILLASLCAGAGQLTMTRAFRDLPVAEGSLLQMLVPIGIALGGFAFFGERFSPHEIVGAALILGGTVLTLRRA